MIDGHLAKFSAFIAELADFTERLPPADFRHSALEGLRAHIHFSAAIWGSATIGEGLAFRDAIISGLPESALAEIETAASVDPRLLQVVTNPGKSFAYSSTAEDPELLRVNMARHGVKHVISTASFDAELGIASGITLLGAETDAPFDEATRQFMEASFDHLLRAWSSNQIRAIEREIAATAAAPSHAAASRHGVLSAAQDGFLALFRREWPGWRGPLLPADVRGLLLAADGGQHMGAEIVLRVRHGHDVSLLQIRERVSADELRPRERAVAELCAGGSSYREIAQKLGIAPATARNHIAAVHKRLGVSRNSEISALLAAAR